MTTSNYATRAQTADKGSSSNKLTRIINPEPNTSSDQHIMLSDNPNVLAEDYEIIISYSTFNRS